MMVCIVCIKQTKNIASSYRFIRDRSRSAQRGVRPIMRIQKSGGRRGRDRGRRHAVTYAQKPPMCLLYVTTRKGCETKFLIRETETLASVFAIMNEKEKLDPRKTCFIYQGERLKKHETPRGCGMKKKVYIDMIVTD